LNNPTSITAPGRYTD